MTKTDPGLVNFFILKKTARYLARHKVLILIFYLYNLPQCILDNLSKISLPLFFGIIINSQ